MEFFNTLGDVRTLRHRLGLNQRDFWSQLGITQSGGSRYENGMRMPVLLQTLIRLHYVENIDLDRINRDDDLILEYLRAHPEQYRALKFEARAFTKRQCRERDQIQEEFKAMRRLLGVGT